VLVDACRLADSFAPIDFFESRNLPFVVAINQFQGTHPPAHAGRGSRDHL
jgi:signal recognition particle receptor subunit beta